MTNLFRTPAGRRRLVLLAMIAAAGGILSAAAYVALRAKELRLARTQLAVDTEQMVRAIERRFRADAAVIYPLGSFIKQTHPGTRSDFHHLAQRLLRENQDLGGVYWISRVPPAQREEHETRMVAEGYDDYRILEYRPDGRHVPPPARAAYEAWPLALAENLGGSADVVPGLDLRTVPHVRGALASAVRSHRVTVTEPLEWDASGSRVFLVVQAVYEEDVTHLPPDERPDRLLGILALTIKVKALLAEPLAAFPRGVDVILFGESERTGRHFACYYDAERGETQFTPEPPEDQQASSEPLAPVALEVPEHRWDVACLPTPAYLDSQISWLPAATRGFGLLLTAILTTYANTLLGRTEKVRQLVAERTAELATERFLLTTLLRLAPDFIYFKDPQGRFLRVSDALARHFGLSAPADAVGKSDFDFHPPELARQYLADEQAVMQSVQPIVDKEECQTGADQRRVFLSTTKVPLRGADGTVVGTFGISRNITARKQAQEQAEYERYLLKSLMDNIPDSIFFKDLEGRYIRINRAKALKDGFRDPSEAIGKADADVFADEHVRQSHADDEIVIQTGRPLINKEELLVRPDGRKTWVSTTRMPLLDAQGRPAGTFGIAHDITAQIRAAEALRIAKEAAEAASRSKSEFLANMSHEIRTPLNAVIGMTELVLETELASAQREYLKMALTSATSLLSVIDDILDFSKIEAGKLRLEEAEFNLCDDVGGAMQALALRAHGKALELACELAPDVPERLIGDVGRLRQVLVNLVGNAIKFTDAGEVVLRIACDYRSDTDALLHFTVTDTGIGIAEDKQYAIFEAFEQGDTSSTRRFGGTGLGLAICSRLAGFLGGRLWVDSELGHGSTFHFTAMFRVPERASSAPGTSRSDANGVRENRAAPLAGTQVLVVDDNATSRRILYELLRRWQVHATLAPDAPEALTLLERARAAGPPYPLAIIDADMPGTDGFALAEQIKRDPRFTCAVVMLLTSGDQPKLLRRGEELGVAASLFKPVKPGELLDAMRRALGLGGATPEVAPSAAASLPPLPRLRILVAEDSLMNQKLAVALLEKHGHHVTVANDGREALAACEAQTFDVVLMDVQMPEMDGYEATAAIRAREQRTGRHVPIIAMTAHAMKGDREHCLDVGMDGYVSKPIRVQQLFEALGAVVGRPAS